MSIPPHKPEGREDKSAFVSVHPEDSNPDSKDRPLSHGEDDAPVDHLNVPGALNSFRTSFDTLSNFSLYSADNDNERLPARLPSPNQRSWKSSGSIPPKSWQITLQDSWISNKGCFLVLIAQFFGSSMGLFTRMLETDGAHGKGMHPFQILFVRMSITLFCSGLYMWLASVADAPWGPKERLIRLLLVLRGVGGFCGVVGFYYSLLYLPLAEATVLTFLGPIVACWACSLLLHEPFTRTQQVAAWISLVGVVLIARPVSLLSALHSSPDASTSGPPAARPSEAFTPANLTSTNPFATQPRAASPIEHVYAILFALLGVFGSACAVTSIRWIGTRAHPLISVSYFSIWCTLVSAVSMVVVPSVKFRLPGNITEWTLLFVLGANGFVMQYLLTAGLAYNPEVAQIEVERRRRALDGTWDGTDLSLRSEKAGQSGGSKATSMLYTNMLFALMFDKIVWGTSPSIISWVGCALILGSAMCVALKKEDGDKKGTDQNDRSKNEEEGRRLMGEEEVGEGSESRRGRPLRQLDEVELRTMR